VAACVAEPCVWACWSAGTATASASRPRRAQVKPKAKSSFSSLSSAFTSVLSVSSSGRSPPELVPEQQLAACSGNWLSHLDWDGKRCGPDAAAAAAARAPLAARARGLGRRNLPACSERPRPDAPPLYLLQHRVVARESS